MTEANAQPVSWSTALVYGAGAIASAAKSVPISTFLMLYYNQVVGLPALAVATVMMVSLVFDAICDPLAGHVSDNYRSVLGRRLPFMYAAIVPTTVLFVMLWTPPINWPEWAVTAYFAVCLIGLRFFDTLFELPHLALIPEISTDYNERTRLFTVRHLFEAVGGVGITVAAYNVFMKERPDGTGGLLSPEGYPSFALFTAGVILIAAVGCTFGLHRRLSGKLLPAISPATLKKHFRDMAATLRSPSLAILAAASVCISIGSGISSALSLYWLMYFYRFSQVQMTVLLIPVTLGMLAIALAPAISRRLGKRKAMIALLLAYTIATTLPLIVRLFDILSAQSTGLLVLVGIQSAVGAASMTMVLIILASTTADLVEESEVRTGRRSEGLLLAANSFVRKATQGLGALGAGVILTLVAFPEEAERAQVAQSVMNEMAWIYMGVTAVLSAVTGVILSYFRYDRAAHDRDLRVLAARWDANF